ncbi:MAG: hypothetical protein Fur0018_16510 [Anaerolineales bacterium]
MQPRPYFISVILGSLVLFIWQAISAVLGIGLVRQAMRPLLTHPGSITSEDIAPMMGSGLLLVCLGLFVIGLAYIGSGFLYTYLHQRDEALTSELAVLGGAATGASIGLASGIFRTLLFLLMRPIVQQAMQQAMPPGNMPLDQFSPSMMLFSIAPSLVGICMGIVFAAALGFMGGLIGSLVFRDAA